MEDDIKQVWCKKCEGMKKLVVNGKIITWQNWRKYIMLECDIGCICSNENLKTKKTVK